MQQPEGMPKAVVFIANSLPPIGTCWPNAGSKHVYFSVSEAMGDPWTCFPGKAIARIFETGEVLIDLPKLSSD